MIKKLIEDITRISDEIYYNENYNFEPLGCLNTNVMVAFMQKLRQLILSNVEAEVKNILLLAYLDNFTLFINLINVKLYSVDEVKTLSYVSYIFTNALIDKLSINNKLKPIRIFKTSINNDCLKNVYVNNVYDCFFANIHKCKFTNLKKSIKSIRFYDDLIELSSEKEIIIYIKRLGYHIKKFGRGIQNKKSIFVTELEEFVFVNNACTYLLSRIVGVIINKPNLKINAKIKILEQLLLIKGYNYNIFGEAFVSIFNIIFKLYSKFFSSI